MIPYCWRKAKKACYTTPMTSREYFIFGFTFFIGICSGAYLYVTAFAPAYVDNDSVVEVSEIDFRVQGQMIGGCQMGGACPSFVLEDNRSFEYTPSHAFQDVAPDSVTGKIDRGLFASIHKRAKASDFQQLQKEGGTCAASYDGMDYQYEMVLDGESYDLNSCNTLFGDSLLEKELQELWPFFSETDSSADGEDMADFLRNKLDESFEDGSNE